MVPFKMKKKDVLRKIGDLFRSNNKNPLMGIVSGLKLDMLNTQTIGHFLDTICRLIFV